MKGLHKLLFVVNDAAFFLSHRLPIARAAGASGFDVHVATPLDASVERIEKEGLTFHPLTLNRHSRGPRRELTSLVGLYRLYRNLRPDMIHHVTNKPILYGGIAARLAGIRAVVQAVSGLGYLFISRSPQVRLFRSMLNHAYRVALDHENGRVIFQNPEDEDFLVGRGLVRSERTVIIKGAGVEVHQFVPTPESSLPLVVVMAARILWNEGVGEFVDAARLLKAEAVRARLVLVGDADPGNPASVTPDDIAAWVREGAVE